MNQTEGCSPLKINFTSVVTGASSPVTYHWDFGNGNSSSLPNPGAVFVQTKSYTVTLTVSDGKQSVAKSKTVSVLKKPGIDFSASQLKGCTPQPITFTANATADQGSISQYTWDFGDGATIQSYNTQTDHIYSFPGKATVSLTVTDNHGCTNTKIIDDMLTILPGVAADFETDKNFVCYTTDKITLTNHSESARPLTYSWDFGDSGTSTDINPAHAFASKGIYTVKLIATTDQGCRDTMIKSALVNVGEFSSSIGAPDTVCQGAIFTMSVTSTPTPTGYQWYIDGGNGPFYYQPLTESFSTEGEHTVRLDNWFGACAQSVTKKIFVRPLPQVGGFVATIPAYCSMPVTVNFKDTNSVSVRSDWKFEYFNTGTGSNLSHTFLDMGDWPVYLVVTDKYGCQNGVIQNVRIIPPSVQIQTTDYINSGCLKLTKKFNCISNTDLLTYNWDFGDGSISSDAEPEHVFNVGNFKVVLHYTTKSGCSGVTDPFYINVAQKPVAGFSSPGGNTVCGPNPFPIIATQTNYTSEWYINGALWDVDNGLFSPSFPDTGKYSITLIQKNGTCADTMTKMDFVTVLPTFPQITGFQNSCDGDRGNVTFTQASRYVVTGVWDFGDGTTMPFQEDQTQITHHFSQSGQHTIRLTTKNGACENTSNIVIYTLLKHTPVLTAPKIDICTQENFNYTLSNLDMQSLTPYSLPYHLIGYQFYDGTFSPPDNYTGYYNYDIYSSTYDGKILTMPGGKDSVSLIVLTPLGCNDTTNYVPYKLKGAQAAFEILSNNDCFKSTMVFNDTSKAQNTTITGRTWNFGDGQTFNTTSGGLVYHKYSDPSMYNVTLQISDAAGCTSTTSIYTHMINVSGPKASFISPGETLHIDASNFFYNTTNYYLSYPTVYTWDFGDGATSQDVYPYHMYTKPGNYEITLIAKNNENGCIDTTTQKVTVLNFNANFSTNTSFLNNQDCSPLVARFTNTSNDYTNVKWDFGDGAYSENNNYPTHIYSNPGKYIVKLMVTGYNGEEKTYIDSIVVPQKTVSISANVTRTCISNAVTLTGVSDASSYLWDFGDGTLSEASDSLSVHYYHSSGNFIPSLVAKDDEGCIATVEMKSTISIDSLHISLGKIPASICTPREIAFSPEIYEGNPSAILFYHWDFGTGNLKDTSNVQTPVFNYADTGNYVVKLKVTSDGGCEKEAETNIIALRGLGARINGPNDICEKTSAQFEGTTLITGNPDWSWIFADGTTSAIQDPSPKKYDNPGDYVIRLIVDNGGCRDTVNRYLHVHSNPQIATSLKDSIICEGSAVSIITNGANTYSWTPSTGLSKVSGNSVIVSPLTDINYEVTGISSFGCTGSGSVKISVIHPFTLQLEKEISVCSGNSIQINATGGTTFEWINDTKGLSNTKIGNPFATPETTTVYTLKANGEQQCFHDTAQIKVIVLATPVVDAGSGTEILAGSTFQLHGSGSSDIVKWQWSPVSYLDCSTCPSPYVTPYSNTTYTLTATTVDGCIATDTVTVKLLCSNSHIFIPTAFTPNHDGLNDVFRIRGEGITKIDHFQIFDRWGILVFECSNVLMDDKKAAWDGLFKGKPVPSGSYVYVVQMSCNGKPFTQKGSVTVLY